MIRSALHARLIMETLFGPYAGTRVPCITIDLKKSRLRRPDTGSADDRCPPPPPLFGAMPTLRAWSLLHNAWRPPSHLLPAQGLQLAEHAPLVG